MARSGEIGRDEFVARLVALCIGGSSGMPSRHRDAHILLASATLWMEPDALYSEAEINENLRRWLRSVCPSLDLDEVTLRRELVDAAYLVRDDSGRHYAAGPGPSSPRFEPEVASVDPAGVIDSALADREERKRKHMARSERARR